MKIRITLIALFLFVYSMLKAQTVITSPETYYIDTPTNGCNGVWAIRDTFNCPVYLQQPCFEFDHRNEDTLFLRLCSLPCNYISSDMNGNMCITITCSIDYSGAIDTTGNTDTTGVIDSASGYAQHFALPSSKWVVVSTPDCCWYNSYYEISVSGDTIIDGINCKKISNSDFTYESGDTVYFYRDNQFRATYYYGAEVGDTISLYNTEQCKFWYSYPQDSILLHDSIILAVIDSIDSVPVGDNFFRRFNSTMINRDSSDFNDLTYRYTEFIGVESSVIYPAFYCAGIVDVGWDAICNYGDSTIQGFYVYDTTWCNVTLDISEITKAKVSVYPNPFTDRLIIEPNISYQLFDLVGRKVDENNLSELPVGTYVLKTKYGSIRVVKTEK